MTDLPVAAGSPRRLVYLGTPEAAVAPLQALVASGFDVALVVTRADKRRGRGSELMPSPVKRAAERLGIAVSHRTADAVEVDADIGVVVAYGQLIKRDVLSRLAMVNLHFSLLPRWRGAAPVERAILAGDQATGVCLMHVAEGLDTGAVFARQEVAIGAAETADELRARLVGLGTEMLVAQLQRGLGPPQPQSGTPTYADKVTAADRALGFSNPASVEHRRVRIGGATTTFRGKRLKVVRAHVAGPDDPPAGALAPGELGMDGMVGCSPGGLVMLTVQPEGKAAMAWRDFANGHRPLPGERLGS